MGWSKPGEQVLIVDAFLDLERRLRDIDADIVLIDLENPNRDVLEQMIRVSGVHRAAGCDVRRQFRTPR